MGISFPKILRIAHRGVSRTAVFVGLGLNAAADPNFSQYELTDITDLRMVPPNADRKTLAQYKKAFSTWITACGLRELEETFCVFLDSVHSSCLVIGLKSGHVKESQMRKRDKDFSFLGMEKKLAILESDFALRPNCSDFLPSISRARNCYTHRGGVVRRKDCNDGDKLIVKWLGYRLSVIHESGEHDILPQPFPKEGVVLPSGGRIEFQVPPRSKSFHLRSVLEFSGTELAEICFSFILFSNEVVELAQTYARKTGFPIREEEQAGK